MTDTELPNDVVLVAPRDKLAYLDHQSVTLDRPMSPIETWNALMSRPMPLLKLAFRTRDLLSAPFGIKRIDGFSRQRHAAPAPGDHLDFFLVEDARPDRLVLTARDVHLDVLVCLLTHGREFSVTASVITHNFVGRLYMLPVAPAHRLIVRSMIVRLNTAA